MDKKIVLIAHPVTGDVAGNVQKIQAICWEVHQQGIIPTAPYLVSFRHHENGMVEDRQMGTEANLQCLKRRYADELWLYGERISPGMWNLVHLAVQLGIPVVPKTEGTRRDLAQLMPWAVEAP